VEVCPAYPGEDFIALVQMRRHAVMHAVQFQLTGIVPVSTFLKARYMVALRNSR
jgi:hypothetical protein